MCQQFDPDIEAALQLYQIATQDNRAAAIQRLAEIGLRTWADHPHYMPERLCGPGHRRRNLHPLTS